MALAGWDAAVPPARGWTVGDPDRPRDKAHRARAVVPLPRPLRRTARVHQEDGGNARRRSVIGTEAKTGVGTMSRKHIGSSIDDFLREEGIFEEAQAQAIKEVVAWQLAEAMKARKISKARMAALLKTSRTQVDRLLDPKNDITLSSLQRAAAIVGCRVMIDLVQSRPISSKRTSCTACPAASGRSRHRG